MDKIAIINELYFVQGKTISDISKLINTSVSYISRVLKKDSRYIQEKERRKEENFRKRREKQKELIYENRKSKIDVLYISMKSQHEQATKELSKSTIIGNKALRKWCSSAYIYNKERGLYIFDKETLLKPADFPLYIKA